MHTHTTTLGSIGDTIHSDFEVISKIKKNKIYLWHKNDIGMTRKQSPFVVSVIEDSNRTLIKCGVEHHLLFIIVLCVFIGFVGNHAIIRTVLNPNFDLLGKFGAIIWGLLMIVFFAYVDRLFLRKRIKKMKEFVENVLDAERIK